MGLIANGERSRRMKAQHEQAMIGVNLHSKIRSVKEREEEAQRIYDALHELYEDIGELSWEEQTAFDRVFGPFQNSPRAQQAKDRHLALEAPDYLSMDAVIPLLETALKMLEQAYELEV